MSNDVEIKIKIFSSETKFWRHRTSLEWIMNRIYNSKLHWDSLESESLYFVVRTKKVTTIVMPNETMKMLMMHF
ncbi:hypothetical protein EPI10_023458 [Gossypium australe]|uniref:Uncharacterized protein n=1 Tax=Gossypium australe TaxID=47621 RepID=A0A5B6VW35_9ROSI|nr:hypothetical protein EPI10_023458 [Gossypium australe]